MLVPKMKVVKYLTLNPLVVIQMQGLVEALGATKAWPIKTITSAVPIIPMISLFTSIDFIFTPLVEVDLGRHHATAG